MYDWSPVETALEDWVEVVTGLPTTWRGRPVDIRYQETGYCELFISADRTIGLDSIEEEYDAAEPNGEQQRTYQRGQRNFTFGIKIQTWIGSVNQDAKYYASAIRDKIGLPIITGAAMAAADISIEAIIADVPVVVPQDGRNLSVHQVDIRMIRQSEEEDTAGQWIETVVGAELEVPEGTTVGTFDFDV